MRLTMVENYKQYMLCGFMALFVGLGIGRFAYSPLIPSIINNHWMNLSHANTVASCLFWGYFLSLVILNRLFKKFDSVKLIKISVLLVGISFFATSFNLGYMWFMVWFLIMGLNTGIIFIKAPTYILSFFNERDKGKASGLMFTGVGAGIVFSGLTSYLLVYLSLFTIWLIISAISLALGIIIWNIWPTNHSLEISSDKKTSKINKKYRMNFKRNIRLSIVSYGFFRFGSLALAIYFSEFIYKYYVNSPQHLVSISWILFGIGIIAGSYLFGFLSKHIGIKLALILALAFASAAIFLLTFKPAPWGLYILIFIAGMGGASPTALFCSIISLVSPPEKTYYHWKNVLLSGAIALAIGTTFFNWLLRAITYSELFYIASFALLISIVFVLFLSEVR